MKTFLAAILFVLAIPALGFGQTSCKSDVSYSWKKTGEETERSVYWARLEREAKDEILAKSVLQEAAERERVQAADICRARHESLADCMAGKFSGLSSMMSALDFSARKKVQEAVAADCGALQGSCLGGKISEPVCVLKAPPVEEKPAEAADSKKKKK